MNSGVLPQLLPKSQTAFAINTTFRGAFATHRPPFVRIILTFPSDEIQTAVESGLYQGGGWYRPDFGPLQIVAQIGGRLFTFTKTTPGNYTVAEITIPGDPNDASVSQVWMWQSEKWLIITDGSTKFPIFYDGMSSRRSFGPSRLLATATAFSQPAPPAIGDSVVVKIGSPYTGPLNVPVLFNGEHYQVISAVTIPASDPIPSPPSQAYSIRLTARYIATPETVTIGSDIVVKPNLIGYSQGPFSFQYEGSPLVRHYADIGNSGQPPNLAYVIIGIDTFRIYYATYLSGGSVIGVRDNFGDVIHQVNYPTGTLISFASNQGPDVVVGQTDTSFNNTSGSSWILNLSVPYTGPDNQYVWIGNNQYTIEAYTPPPTPPTPGTPEAYYMTLLNLSDAGVGNYVNPSPILSTPELPAGRMGTYGMGQTWMSLIDGTSFIASDPVGFSSGLPIYNYRDAVLRTTGAESFLASSGGSFRIPTSGQIINSMTFTAVLDTSLGQGPLQVGTDSNIFSCLAPFDYTATVLPPVILTESLIGFGPLAQNSTIIANSDLLFRSFIGLGSLILARRQFQQELTWGNTPISREMTRPFSQDDEALLPYGSAVVFDNRLLDTCMPAASGQGVVHTGFVSLNFDLVSSLRGKAPPVYDGLWTGLNALQIINIQSGSEARAFVFGVNFIESKIEMYELLKSQDRIYFDNGVTPIKWIIETPILFNQDVKPLNELVRLTNGEMWLQDIIGTINVKVQYRPDFYSGSDQPGCWEDWTEFDICAEAVGINVRPSYRTRIGLGEPNGNRCQENNNRPFRVGHFFQFRLEFTGSAKFMCLRVQAVTQPQIDYAAPECNPVCLPPPSLPDLIIP